MFFVLLHLYDACILVDRWATTTEQHIPVSVIDKMYVRSRLLSSLYRIALGSLADRGHSTGNEMIAAVSFDE